MNVNPFSYLIGKINKKLDRRDDWVSNTDFNTLYSDGFYHVAAGNTNVPPIGGEAEWATMWAMGDATTSSQFFVTGSNRAFYRKCQGGTWGSWNELALKSDIEIKSQSVTFSPYISDAGYIKTWKMGKMYFISFNAPLNPCSADTVLISGFPNTIQRFYGLLGADDGTNIRIELKNGELVTNTAITAWKWYAGNIFFYES